MSSIVSIVAADYVTRLQRMLQGRSSNWQLVMGRGPEAGGKEYSPAGVRCSHPLLLWCACCPYLFLLQPLMPQQPWSL